MKTDFTMWITKGLYELWYYHYNSKYPTLRKDFNRIVKALLEEYKNQILNNSHGVKLDYNLGELSAEWVKPKPRDKTPKDKIKYLNLATNFKKIKIVYRIRKACKRNKYAKLMSFTACDSLKKQIGKLCIENTEIYKNARATTK